MSFWKVVIILNLWQRDCSTLPPNVGALGSDTPIVDYFFGTGLMKMFLWTVGSFHVFGETWDPTCFLQLRINFLKKVQISVFTVYLQRSIMHQVGEAFIFLRFPFRKGSYSFVIPIL